MSEKMDTMPTDKELRRMRITTKVIYGLFVAFFPVAVLILMLLSRMGSLPDYSVGDRLLNVSQIILGSASILSLIIGFLWPRLARWYKKAYVKDMELLYGHLVRAIFFTMPVIHGSILRILGSSWYIVLPIFILAIAALVLTFPTDKRLAKWQQRQKSSH
jgi:fumarate reductase subunit D